MTTTIVVLAAVLVAGVLVHGISFLFLRRAVDAPGRLVAQSLVRHARRPTLIIIPLIPLEVAVAAVHMPPQAKSYLLHSIGILLIFAVAFLVVRLTHVVDDIILARYPLTDTNNLRARQIRTQVQVLRRVVAALVAVVAISLALLSFAVVRAAGAGLLASAGVIAIIAAVAAKPTATNIVAGLQIAMSQPIRVDDVVVVEGHWGRVEQIALTYVVVRVWDLRRLVLPISYFIENPFENWTRSTADILGWVHLEVDYSAPVDAIRRHLHQVLQASPDWDGQTWNLQVTGLGTETMQLRALMSSKDSSTSWNLQCEVREKLVAWLQAHHPGALPRLRSESVPPPAPPLAGAGGGVAGGMPPAGATLTGMYRIGDEPETARDQ